MVARKPLESTVAANVLAHGTGALNIDATRVEANGERFGGGAKGSSGFVDGYQSGAGFATSTAGRWPTNVVLDGHAAEELDRQSGASKSSPHTRHNTARPSDTRAGGVLGTAETSSPADSGGASRFFPTFRYQAKAPTRERPSYVKDGGSAAAGGAIAANVCAACGRQDLSGSRCQCPEPQWVPRSGADKVSHPTVKPLALLEWMVRLVVGGRPDAVVLDPFAGSGTTVEACIREGVHCVAIEREADYIPLIVERIQRATTPAAEPASPRAARAAGEGPQQLLFEDGGAA